LLKEDVVKHASVVLLAGLFLGGCVIYDIDDDPYFIHQSAGAGYYPVDPVCGVGVAPQTHWVGSYRTQRYYFHNQRCQNQFYSHPQSYAQAGNPHRARTPYRAHP